MLTHLVCHARFAHACSAAIPVSPGFSGVGAFGRFRPRRPAARPPSDVVQRILHDEARRGATPEARGAFVWQHDDGNVMVVSVTCNGVIACVAADFQVMDLRSPVCFAELSLTLCPLLGVLPSLQLTFAMYRSGMSSPGV